METVLLSFSVFLARNNVKEHHRGNFLDGRGKNHGASRFIGISGVTMYHGAAYRVLLKTHGESGLRRITIYQPEIVNSSRFITSTSNGVNAERRSPVPGGRGGGDRKE